MNELWRRANTRNVSFFTLQGGIYVFNSVVNTKLPATLPHRRSTTVSLETYPIYLRKRADLSAYWTLSQLCLKVITNYKHAPRLCDHNKHGLPCFLLSLSTGHLMVLVAPAFWFPRTYSVHFLNKCKSRQTFLNDNKHLLQCQVYLGTSYLGALYIADNKTLKN